MAVGVLSNDPSYNANMRSTRKANTSDSSETSAEATRDDFERPLETFCWPIQDGDVREALEQVFRDGNWGRYEGLYCTRLCELLKQFHSTDHVKLCASGTVGIELALRGLRIGTNDEVALAAYDFSGNFRAIESVGARPVLVDVNSEHLSMGVAELNAAESESLRCVIVSHLHSGMAPMGRIMAWAEQRGVLVVEDACQAPGATVDGQIAGTWGDVGVLSFGGSKLLTAGRGGAILTRHAEVLQRIQIYSGRGNEAYPLSELQAAVLIPQLGKLAERNTRRRESVKLLVEHLAQVVDLHPVGWPRESNDPHASLPSYYKFAWYYSPPDSVAGTREQFLSDARAMRIPIEAGFRGFTRRSSRRCRRVGELAASEIASRQLVVLHHPILLADATRIRHLASAIQHVVGGQRTPSDR
jgi:dTDP-4-amino-4,6-dideoxygalactose transaminase